MDSVHDSLKGDVPKCRPDPCTLYVNVTYYNNISLQFFNVRFFRVSLYFGRKEILNKNIFYRKCVVSR